MFRFGPFNNKTSAMGGNPRKRLLDGCGIDASHRLEPVRSVEDERDAVHRFLVTTEQADQLNGIHTGWQRRRQVVRGDDTTMLGDALVADAVERVSELGCEHESDADSLAVS